MIEKVNINSIYTHSSDVVVREIEGEVIIVPLVSGIGDMEEDLFTLNDTGKSIVSLMDGKNSLKEIVSILSKEYQVSDNQIVIDVKGLTAELLKRKMIVEKKK